MSASFKAEPDVREYGFTDEQGNAVTRRPNEDGIITARDAFEERHFRTIGLSETEPPKAKRKSGSRKSAAPKAAKKAAPPPANARQLERPRSLSEAEAETTSSTKAATPAATVEG